MASKPGARNCATAGYAQPTPYDAR